MSAPATGAEHSAARAHRIDVVTIFPDYLRVLDLSLIGKAADSGLLSLTVHDLRDWTTDRHRTVDDTPIGGGAGMVMKPDVWGVALDEILAASPTSPLASEISDAGASPASESAPDPGATKPPVLVIPTPSGEVFTQRTAEELSQADHLIFACGRYEGIDSRVARHYASRGVQVRELSIGDYVLNGGEVASIVMIEAIARLWPGVLGNPESVVEESHSSAGLLEQEVYTRPVAWRGMDIATDWPALLSGDHVRIARERRDQAIARTAARRPDMIERLDHASLDGADRAALARAGWLVPSGAAAPIPATLRPALPADADELAALAARTFPDACPPFLTEEQIQAHIAANLTPERFATWIADRRAILNVLSLDEDLVTDGAEASFGVGHDTKPAARAGELLGYSLVLLEERDQAGELPAGLDPRPGCVPAEEGQLVAELSKVYVDARLRGSGAAALLLAEAQCDAATAGVDALWLGTHEKNRRAQKAYKRAGFAKCGTRTYDVGGHVCRDVVMVTSPASAHRAGS